MISSQKYRSVSTATRYGLDGPVIESQISVAERSKARLAGIAGSNPTGGMDICVVCVVQ